MPMKRAFKAEREARRGAGLHGGCDSCGGCE